MASPKIERIFKLEGWLGVGGSRLKMTIVVSIHSFALIFISIVPNHVKHYLHVNICCDITGGGENPPPPHHKPNTPKTPLKDNQ